MKKMISLALALIMCLSLTIPAFAADSTMEARMQAEIQAREKVVFDNVYEQLKAQDALQFFDLYKNIFGPDIEASVRAEYGQVQLTRAVSYYCPYGAVATYYEPNSRCNVAITYLDQRNTEAYVLEHMGFSASSAIATIFGLMSLPDSLKPFAFILGFVAVVDSMCLKQINDAGGYARIINTENPIDGTRASVIGGWFDHVYVSFPSNAQNTSITTLPYHDPWA